MLQLRFSNVIFQCRERQQWKSIYLHCMRLSSGRYLGERCFSSVTIQRCLIITGSQVQQVCLLLWSTSTWNPPQTGRPIWREEDQLASLIRLIWANFVSSFTSLADEKWAAAHSYLCMLIAVVVSMQRRVSSQCLHEMDASGVLHRRR